LKLNGNIIAQNFVRVCNFLILLQLIVLEGNVVRHQPSMLFGVSTGVMIFLILNGVLMLAGGASIIWFEYDRGRGGRLSIIFAGYALLIFLVNFTFLALGHREASLFDSSRSTLIVIFFAAMIDLTFLTRVLSAGPAAGARKAHE